MSEFQNIIFNQQMNNSQIDKPQINPQINQNDILNIQNQIQNSNSNSNQPLFNQFQNQNRQIYVPSLLFQLINHFQQILPIRILDHRLRQLTHLRLVNPATAVGNALQTSHFQALTFLYHLNIGRCLSQRIVRSCVEPGETTTQRLHLQLPVLKESLVHRRDLIFATGRRLNGFRYIHNILIVEIQPRYRIIGFLLSWLFLQA